MRVDAVMSALVGGTVNYRFMPRGGGCLSRGQLSGAELAGLLSGLSGEAVDLAYGLYAADEDALLMLRLHVQLYAAALAVGEQWSGVSDESVRRLGALAVFELASAGRCGVCAGTGVYRACECGLCAGVGVVPTSGRQRAEFVLVPETSWRRVWAERYARVYAYVAGIDADVRHVIQRNSRAVF